MKILAALILFAFVPTSINTKEGNVVPPVQTLHPYVDADDGSCTLLWNIFQIEL